MKRLYLLLIAVVMTSLMAYATGDDRRSAMVVVEAPETQVASSSFSVDAAYTTPTNQLLAFNQLALSLIQADVTNSMRDQALASLWHQVDESADIMINAYQIASKTPLNLEDAHSLMHYSRQFDLNPALILSLVDIESEFDKHSVGTANDRGFMQIIPSTERWLAKRFGGELGLSYQPTRIFDNDYQFQLGMAYLRFLKQSHRGDLHRILSEYNRGPYNLAKYHARTGTYKTSYSKKVIANMANYSQFNQ